jgi:anti-sigma B factor antagonist
VEISVARSHDKGSVTVLHIRGDIDIHSYQALEAAGRQAVADGADHIVLDLSDVNYISSAGLRAIHAIFHLLSGRPASANDATVSRGLRDGTFKSQHLKLVNPTAQVLQVLQTTGFDMFLEIHPDLRAAVASF